MNDEPKRATRIGFATCFEQIAPRADPGLFAQRPLVGRVEDLPNLAQPDFDEGVINVLSIDRTARLDGHATSPTG